MVILNNNYSPMGSGGGGDFPIVTIGAVGLAGWSIWNLWGVSAALAVGAGVYVLFAFACFFVASMTSNSGLIKFLLFLSILSTAAVWPYISIGNHQLASILIAVTLGLFALAWLLGLWRELGWWNMAALACVVMFAGTALEQRDTTEEMWNIQVKVRDNYCTGVAEATVTCEVISKASAEVDQSLGPSITGAGGGTQFFVRGSPSGKVARCTAGKQGFQDGSAIGEPGLFAFADVQIQLVPTDYNLKANICDD